MKTCKAFNCFLVLAACLLALHTTMAGTLTLTFATNFISEAAGPGATTATIKLDAAITNDLPLILRGAVDATKIYLPAALPYTIPAGASNLTFAIDSVNNGDIDGNKTVTLTFGADGYNNTSASLLVTDDDTPTHRTIGGRLAGTVAGTNTYYVADNLTIQPGTTLTILPASQLLFATNLGLTCNGILMATGNFSAPIVFTRSATNAYWDGLSFVNTVTKSVLNDVEISYANNDGGIRVTAQTTTCPVVVSNSVIHDCVGNGVTVTSWDGITIGSQVVQIVSNTIYGNGLWGVQLVSEASQCNSSENSTSVTGNEIYNNRDGVLLDASVYYNGCSATCYTTVDGKIEDNYIHGNRVGINCLADTGAGTGANHIRNLASVIQNNLILNNSVDGIELNGAVEQSLAPKIINNTIAGNGNAGIYHVNRQLAFTFENNLLLQNNYGIQCASAFTGRGVVVAYNNAWGNYVSNWMDYPAAYGAVLTNNLNGTGADTNLNLSVDPLTVSGIDFHLQADSPAIDAGTTNLAPTNDIVGVNRRGFPDIGCYEYGSLLLTPGLPTAKGTFPLLTSGGRGTPFTVQASTDLKNWTSITNTTLTNLTAWLPVPVTNAGRMFYRAQIH
jgi:hypothetical protein